MTGGGGTERFEHERSLRTLGDDSYTGEEEGESRRSRDQEEEKRTRLVV